MKGEQTLISGHRNDLEHSINCPAGLSPDVFRNLDDILCISESFERIFQRNPVHVGAADTAEPEHLLPGILGGDVVPHCTFGKEKVTGCTAFTDGADHLRRAAGKVRGFKNLRAALRVCQNIDVRELSSNIRDILNRKLLVYFTPCPPSDHALACTSGHYTFTGRYEISPRLSCHISSQVFIRKKDHRIGVQRFDNLDGIA